MMLLQIFSWFWQWKNFENRLIFDEAYKIWCQFYCANFFCHRVSRNKRWVSPSRPRPRPKIVALNQGLTSRRWSAQTCEKLVKSYTSGWSRRRGVFHHHLQTVQSVRVLLWQRSPIRYRSIRYTGLVLEVVSGWQTADMSGSRFVSSWSTQLVALPKLAVLSLSGLYR